MKDRITLVVTQKDIDEAVRCQKSYWPTPIAESCPVAQSAMRHFDDFESAGASGLSVGGVHWRAVPVGRHGQLVCDFDDGKPVRPTRFTYERVV